MKLYKIKELIQKKDEESKIINTMEKLSKKILKFSEYKNEINIKYHAEEKKSVKIFGKKFVENNEDNIDLFINEEYSPLTSKYELNKGDNNVKLIIKKNLTNLENMFKGCYSLDDITELKYMNIKEVEDFSNMFPSESLLKKFEAFPNYVKWKQDNSSNNSSEIIIIDNQKSPKIDNIF